MCLACSHSFPEGLAPSVSRVWDSSARSGSLGSGDSIGDDAADGAAKSWMAKVGKKANSSCKAKDVDSGSKGISTGGTTGAENWMDKSKKSKSKGTDREVPSSRGSDVSFEAGTRTLVSSSDSECEAVSRT